MGYMGKGCLNCQNFVSTGTRPGNISFNEPVPDSLRIEKGLGEYLRSFNPKGPSRLRCQDDNWDSVSIRNPEEIIRVITTYDRSKCAHFLPVDTLATPEAVERRDKIKKDNWDKIWTRGLSIFAILISITALIVSLRAS
jgi:hypothetical protein